MERLSRVVTGCIGLAMMAGAARADVATLVAHQDTTMYADDGNRSNGSGTFLFAGSMFFGGDCRALVSFDLSGIPQGSTITEVNLRLHISEARPGSPPATITAHRVFGAWGEGGSNAGLPGDDGAPAQAGDATWTMRVFPNTPWNGHGGDFSGFESSMGDAGETDTSFTIPSTPAFVADVQEWLDTPATNNGWVLIGPQTLIGGRRFHSRESSLPATRPTLVVTYTPLMNVCPADLDNGSGNGTPDAAVDINDLLYFLVQFEAGTEDADLDNGSGTGTTDGAVDINDLLYFLVRFEGGC